MSPPVFRFRGSKRLDSETSPRKSAVTTKNPNAVRDPQLEPSRGIHDEFWPDGPPPGTPEHREWMRFSA